MKFFRLTLPVLLFSFVLNRPALAAPPERSLSSSRQFIIYGPNVVLRGAMGDLAEQTKAGLLGLLKKRDNWATPILLNVQFRQANVPEMAASQLHVSQTGSGLKLQLDLTIPEKKLDRPSIQRDLLRAIFVEIIYRSHPETPAGTMYSEAPPWLIEGVLARSLGEQRQTLNDLLMAAAESDKIISLGDFLLQQPEQLDSQGRALYRAYAAALLQFLLEQPSGTMHLSAYIESLSRASNDPLSDLRSQFTEMGNSGTLEALWKSAVAKFASAARYEFLLSFVETQRQLDELLRTPIPGATGKDKPLELEKLGNDRPTAIQIPALQSLGRNLLLLAANAHPLLRPVVARYGEIAQLATSRKRVKLTSQLLNVKETRSRLASRMTDIDDYMNWFEATQLGTTSGAFTNYLKAAGHSEEPEKRHDALSVYLDAVEAQFGN